MGNKISQNIDKDDEQGEIEKNVMSPINQEEYIGEEEIRLAEQRLQFSRKKQDELKRARLTRSTRPRDGDLQVKFLETSTLNADIITYQSEVIRNNSERSGELPASRTNKRSGSIMTYLTSNPNAK